MSGADESSPLVVHLLSSSNEGQTNKLNLLQMGQNLAKEIEKFVNATPVQSISFFCHSLGGLIARSCLGGPLGIIERLPSVKLESFLSLSTPHLGLGLSNNVLFDSGITVLKYWAECPVLHELLLEDPAKALQNLPLLNRFAKVRVLGCKEDGYCPIESALLSYDAKGTETSASQRMTAMKTLIVKSMATKTQFESIEVTFEGQANTSAAWSLSGIFDSMIGRAAHINMLEDHKLTDALIFSA
jgi:hypothetical protein